MAPWPVSRLRRWRAHRRIDRTDQRFFDAYGLGGRLARRPLVLPVDFLLRPAVRAMLTDWLSGDDAFDLGILESAWRRTDETGEVDVFRENVIHLLAVLADDRQYAPAWPGILHIMDSSRDARWPRPSR